MESAPLCESDLWTLKAGLRTKHDAELPFGAGSLYLLWNRVYTSIANLGIGTSEFEFRLELELKLEILHLPYHKT